MERLTFAAQLLLRHLYVADREECLASNFYEKTLRFGPVQEPAIVFALQAPVSSLAFEFDLTVLASRVLFSYPVVFY